MKNSNEQPRECPKCGEDIKIDANKCKYCGADLRNWFVRHWAISLLLIFFAIGNINSGMNSYNERINEAIGSNTTTNKPISQEQEQIVETPIKVTANELFDKYNANEVKADDMYKGKLLEVSGTIESIGKAIFDKPYVALRTDKPYDIVQCMLADSQKAKASTLTKDTPIILVGRGSGKSFNVIISDCIIQ